MKPFVKSKQKGTGKFKAQKTDHVDGYSKGVSRYDKLVTKNANRGMAKGARQEAKKEIRDILNQFI